MNSVDQLYVAPHELVYAGRFEWREVAVRSRRSWALSSSPSRPQSTSDSER